MDKPRVSIVMPAYNCIRYISWAVESVLEQSYPDWELIIVDDCSQDGSRERIETFSALDSRIRAFRNERNLGVGRSRNRGVELAKGEWIAFLDSDDLWEPEKLSRQLQFMAEKGCAFSYSRIRMTDSEGNTIKDNISVPESIDYRGLLRRTVIATSTVMLDREQTGDFRMPLRRGGQDYATWLQLLRRTGRAYGINESLTAYRNSGGSLSSNKLDSIRQVYQIQTHDEHISRPRAVLNTLCFCMYAFKKHYL